MARRGAGRRPVLLALAVVLALLVGAAVVAGPGLLGRLRADPPEAGTVSRPGAPIERGQRPRPADAFVDSIGVNTHLHYEDTAYAQFDDLVRPRLRELGVRHLRDAAYTTPDAVPEDFFYERVRALAADGMDFQYTVTAEDDGTVDFSRLPGVVASSDGAVTAFEGLNEPDLSGVGDWPVLARSVQEQLFPAVRALGPGAPQVVLPSVTTREAAAALGPLGSVGDVANLHAYYAGRQPETAGFGDDDFGSLSWYRREMSDVMGPSLPVMSTETGYYSARGGEFWVSPEAKATYVPRLLMYHFANGVDRTYLYELLDQTDDPDDPQSDFGLVENDGTPKAAFLAVRDLVALLADPGPAFGTTPVDVTVDAPDDVAQVLLQKRDGRTYVVLWSTRPVWDVDDFEAVRVPDRTVSVGVPDGYAVSRVVRLSDSGPAADQPVPPAGPTAEVAVGPTLSVVELTPDAG